MEFKEGSKNSLKTLIIHDEWARPGRPINSVFARAFTVTVLRRAHCPGSLCKPALTGNGTGRVTLCRPLPAVPSCLEAQLLRMGPTACMKTGEWLSRCMEFKQKDVTCHFGQRVASLSLALGAQACSSKALLPGKSTFQHRQRQPWLGSWISLRTCFFNGLSTLKSVYFILKPGLPAFLGLSRDPAEVGHRTGQQLPRGGRQPRSCMRMYTPVTVPTMLCHLTGFSPEVTGVGVMAEIGLVER